MFCPSCGKENAQSFGYCNFCGKELVPIPAKAPAATTPGAPIPTPLPYGSAAPAPAPTSYPTPSPVQFQTAPAPRKSNTALIVVGIVLLALAGGAAWVLTHKAEVGRLLNTEDPQQLVGRLMREAAGMQPVHDPFFSDHQFNDAFRELCRNLFRVNQEFMARIKALDMSQIGKVGTPQSIVDPDYAAEGIKQVHAALAL